MGADNAQLLGWVGPAKSSWRKWRRVLKRSTSRLARRLGKRFLEDAPPHRTSGSTS